MVKVYCYSDVAHTAWPGLLWWELRDLQGFLCKGGTVYPLSSRWLWSHFGPWKKLLSNMPGYSGVHLRMAAARPTRGHEASPDLARDLPEHTASTYGMLFLLCHMASESRCEEHIAKRAAAVLEAFRHTFLQGQNVVVPFTMHQPTGFPMGKHIDTHGAAELCLDGGLLYASDILASKQLDLLMEWMVARGSFDASGQAAIDKAARDLSHHGKEKLFLVAQLLNIMGSLVEEGFGPGSQSTDPLQPRRCSKKGSRPDPALLEAVAFGKAGGEKVNNSNAMQKVLKGVGMMQAQAKCPEQDILLRYHLASHQLLKDQVNISVCLDAGQVGNKKWMCICMQAMDKSGCPEAAWAVPQAHHKYINRADLSVHAQLQTQKRPSSNQETQGSHKNIYLDQKLHSNEAYSKATALAQLGLHPQMATQVAPSGWTCCISVKCEYIYGKSRNIVFSVFVGNGC